jgi:hypothetical protein
LRLYARRCAPQILIELPTAPGKIADDGRELDGDRLGWRRRLVLAAETEKKRCIQAETGGLA